MKEQIEQQAIEEMARDLCKCLVEEFGGYSQEFVLDAKATAEKLYNADYRKVIHCKDCEYRDTEGCSLTYWNGGELVSNVEDNDFCSGAKMKGGAE